MRNDVAARWLVVGVGVGVGLCLASTRLAAAQPIWSAPADRKGPFLAAAVGMGATSPALQCFVDIRSSDAIHGCGGLALTIEGGWLFSRRLAGALHVASSGPWDLRSGALHDATALTVQYWPSPRLWFRAGAGWGSRSDVVNWRTGRHLAVVSAAGYEVYRTRRPRKRGEGTMDVQLRMFASGGGPGVRTTSVSLSVGMALFQTRGVPGSDGS